MSAEKLVSDFRSRRVALEVAAFGEAASHARVLAERALSNEIITPGTTTLEDVARCYAEPPGQACAVSTCSTR